MKASFLTCLFSFICLGLFGQDKDTWTAFWNKKTNLAGFKDQKGVVKIKPKFVVPTIAEKFDDIIAVIEERKGGQRSYYLTKTGRHVGADSLYIFENAPDCESEGYIRFKDPKTDKTGMFNKNGEVAIPAVYSTLSHVVNGMVIALLGAKKQQIGEHYTWEGGEALLIDARNKVLIHHFNYEGSLNLFSLLISPHPNKDSIRANFKGVNGQYYSFIDFKQEFRAWLKSSFLVHLTENNLLKYSSDELYYWKEHNPRLKKQSDWVSESKSKFINRHFELLKNRLLELNTKQCKYAIFEDGLNPYIYTSPAYKVYFDNCGNAKESIYPALEVVISHGGNRNMVQDSFEFLRTSQGYKLVSVTIRDKAGRGSVL